MIATTGGALALAVASLLLARAASAQAIELTAFGLAATNAEVDETRQAKGLGLGAGVATRLGRFGLELRGQTASLDADFAIQPDYVVNELALTGTYWWRPALGVMVGLARRFTSPDLAAQDVGAVAIGVSTVAPLSSLGRVRAHAAWLPVTRFSGGGDGGLALEIGLGVAVGHLDRRFNVLVEYSYQRIDRKVHGIEVPIQYSTARAGIVTRW